MNILGINFGHDASLALFSDGKLVQFEELERASRIKHQYGVTSGSIGAFLKKVGFKLQDIHLVSVGVTQFWAYPHSEDIKFSSFGEMTDMHKKLVGGKSKFGAVSYEQGQGTGGPYYQKHLESLGIKRATMSLGISQLKNNYLVGFDYSGELLVERFARAAKLSKDEAKGVQSEFLCPGVIEIRGRRFPAFLVDHHFCHANYSYFYSPAECSLISTHDGGLPVLPFNSGGLYISNENGVVPLIDHRLALGYLYDQVAVAALVGEPGKLMGLSSYAISDYSVLELAHRLIRQAGKMGRAEIDGLVQELCDGVLSRQWIREKQTERFEFDEKIHFAHIQAAANAQSVVEEVFVNSIGAAAALVSAYDAAYSVLNLTGGFTLNCPTNNLLKQKFQSLAVNPLPGCGDTGGAIGACVAIMPFTKDSIQRDGDEWMAAAFPPLEFTTAFSEADYEQYGLEKINFGESVPAFIASALVDKKILCIFRGRSEVGPRALGRRSIIAHAIDGDIRDRINASKGREAWRPLAPICRAEDYGDYFDGDSYDSRYMLFTNRVKNPALKGVIHVDGSARAQAIKQRDGWLHEALSIMKTNGNIPVIINTSFNCAGEPIVESIQDAFKSFSRMNFDYLVTEWGIFRPSVEG